MSDALFSLTIKESFLRKALVQIKRQKPKWFNYGTQYFIENPAQCPSPLPSGDFLEHQEPVTVVGPHVLHYVVQVGEVKFDLYPGSVPGYPPEVRPEPQYMVVVLPIKCKALCVNTANGSISASHEFDVDVWAKLGYEFIVEPEDSEVAVGRSIEKLRFTLSALELQDVGPTGLEGIIELVASRVLEEMGLKGTKIPLEKTIELPTGPDTHVLFRLFRQRMANNPAIDNDEFRLLLDAEIIDS